MTPKVSVALAPLTTFHIGGPARELGESHSEEDIQSAISHARASGLPLFVLGAGSNILIPDTGVDGVVLCMKVGGLTTTDVGEHVELVAGAGTSWDDVVNAASTRGLYGIENLAGIPGSVGGAAVQNIGAYGAELSSVFLYADVIDAMSGDARRVTKEEALFSYRSSIFKTHPELIIVRVALALRKEGSVQIAYADLARTAAEGIRLETPQEVATAVRTIRSRKFPTPSEGGTAGSFFKNPVIFQAEAAALLARYPGLPSFPQADGRVKVPLAWILDHVLSLKGFAQGRVRLYEKQPLVIVAEHGASANEVDALAAVVSQKVFDATGITIEREVETFGVRQ